MNTSAHSTTIEPVMDSPPASSGLLGWLSRLGIATLTVGAVILRRPSGATADSVWNWWHCCQLKHPRGSCGGGGASHSCPYGGVKRTWTCCEGLDLYFCSECTNQSSCFYGPWYCSEAWGSTTMGC